MHNFARIGWRCAGLVMAWVAPLAPAQTWEDISPNIPGPASTSNHRPLDTDGTRLYLLGAKGVYVSGDDGASFQPINTVPGASYSLTNLGHRFVKHVNGWVWLGSDPGSGAINDGHATLHRLAPGQTEWSKSSATGFPIGTVDNQADDIAHDATTGTYYVAAALGGAFVSTNGLDWEQRTTGLSGLGLPATVVAFNGAAYLLRPLGKVHRTTNQGQSWTALSSHPGNSSGFLFHHRGRLLFSTFGSITTEDGVYYTDDGGGTWKFHPGLKGSAVDLASDGNLLFAAGYFGYLGVDGFKFSATDGLTWDRLPTNGLPASFIASRIVRQGNYLFMHVPGTAKLYRLNLTGVDFTPTTQIARQPAATVNRVAGQPLSLEVVAGGAQITYQWRRGGVDLPGATNAVYAVAVAATNDAGAYTVVVTGSLGAVTSSVATVNVVARDEGRLDISYPSLNAGGKVEVLPNGELLAFNNSGIYRYSPEGQLLTNRTVSGVNTFTAFTLRDGSNRVLRISTSPNRLWRFLPDTLASDPAFNQLTANSTIRTVVEWPGRGYLVGGDFTTVTNAAIATNAHRYLILINYAGVLDTSFSVSNAPNGGIGNIVLDAGTNIFVQGGFNNWFTDFLPQGFVKLQTNGVRDTSFAPPNTLSGNSFLRWLSPGRFLAVDSSGKPVILLSNGTLDASFNPSNQVFSANAVIRAMVIGESNKVYLAGSFNRYAGISASGYVRLLPNGLMDTNLFTSTGSGNLTSIAYDPRGYLYYTTTTGPFRLFAGTNAAAAAEGFADWVAQFGLTQDLQAAGADADADGIPNVFEYYFGSSPTNAASGARPSLAQATEQGQEYPAITFVRQKNVSGVSLSAQVSSSAAFSDSLGAATETVTDLGNGLERVTIRSSVSAAAQPVQFLRIRLTVAD